MKTHSKNGHAKFISVPFSKMMKEAQHDGPYSHKKGLSTLFLSIFLLISPAGKAEVSQWYYENGTVSQPTHSNEPRNPYPVFTSSSSDPRDPIEPFNRIMFFTNDLIDGLFLQPLSKMYNGAVPDFMKTRIRNVLTTLMHPVVFGNDLLQGDFEDAGITISRLVINATVGVGGLFEVAEDWGFPYQKKDLGQTFARWGIGEGFYFVIPILGPSTAREAVGRVGDAAMNPLTWTLEAPLAPIYGGSNVLEARADVEPLLEDLKANSVDYYAAIRTWYFERRKRVIEGYQDELLDTPTPDDEE
ncbi:VacJ family lipoprotein [Candidatus Bealeia paramacronuclearis]|uniref:VacJ family lipoprotein n=1 Tax=Candidatus Bealeia paramacronuclearis TaxID=1921001 RepID=A0ABZ2C6B8_9PROT|nr:VacJ family lipoprotein [Candidatus Bealeia paramacronuclearis]